jgi:hypothetical protein
MLMQHNYLVDTPRNSGFGGDVMSINFVKASLIVNGSVVNGALRVLSPLSGLNSKYSSGSLMRNNSNSSYY